MNQGSFGKIYLVERRGLQQQFAMKTIRLGGIDRYQCSSILTEIKILLTNSSEYLLTCYDLFIYRKCLCIITEYVDGGDLNQYIKSNKNINYDTIMQLFLKICVGINAMHTNHIMHRDIKPANILITKTGDIKICDFGICKILEYTKTTSTIVGTPYFMSPEQMNQRHYDYKSDIWGIGCVLYTLLYNKYPFTGKTLYDLKRNVRTTDPFTGIKPNHYTLHNILKKMLNKNRSMRPDLTTFLGNTSNQKLLTYHGICHQATPFRKYTLRSIPSNEREWCSIVEQMRKDFSLPALLCEKTYKIIPDIPDTHIPDTHIPTIPCSLSNITSNKEIRRKPAIPPVPRCQVRYSPRQALQYVPCKLPNSRPSIVKPDMVRCKPPYQVRVAQPTNYCTPPTRSPSIPAYRPSYRPAPQIPARPRPVFNKHEPLLKYLRNKDYPLKKRILPTPRPASDRLPPVKNRYKHIQSKVKKYWT